ncbi:deubiquitinase MYSM1-like [Styela clava]
MDSTIIVASTNEDELVDIENDDATFGNCAYDDVTIDSSVTNKTILHQETIKISPNGGNSRYDDTNLPFKRTKTDKIGKSTELVHENDLTRWWRSANEYKRSNVPGSNNASDAQDGPGHLELDPMLREPVSSDSSGMSATEGEANIDVTYYDDSGDIFLPPKRERELPLDVISEEEREVFPEFFSGQTKYCPGKYLNIRNAILKLWIQNKPSHVNKVMLRPILKKGCGNVNNIGRIHRYLESVGAINYGSDLVWWKKQKKRQKPRDRPQSINNHTALDTDFKLKRALEQRMSGRSRKRPASIIPATDNLIGGYTIDHANNNQIVIPQSKEEPQPKSNVNKFKLIKCKEYEYEVDCPYDVTVHASALIVVDAHSHLSRHEVMGLLGGYITNDDKGRIKVHIVCAQPCKSSSSARHCEMNSVSQAVANDHITTRGLTVIGWYHSHPTFPSHPSETDIKTQFEQQTMFSNHGSVFLGLIISSHHRYKVKSEVNIVHIEKGGTDMPETPFRIPFTVDDTLPNGGSRGLLINILSELTESASADPSSRIAQLHDPIVEGSTITQLEKIMKSLSSFVITHCDSNETSQRTKIAETKYDDSLVALPKSISLTDPFMAGDAEQLNSIYNGTNDSYAISSNFSLFSENSFDDYDVISHCDIISQCDNDVTNMTSENESASDMSSVTWKNILDEFKVLLFDANSKSLEKIT